jgi:hypothetical protein
MGATLRYVKKIVKHSNRPIALANTETTDSAIRRLLFDVGDEIDDLMILSKSDITTKNTVKQRLYKDNFNYVAIKIKQLEEKDCIRNWYPPISGQDIMKAFNLHPCKKVGIIKNTLKEAILAGKIPNKVGEARSFMLKLGKSLGLKTSKGTGVHQ